MLKDSKFHHIGVAVKDIEAVAFCGSRVCFLFNKNVGLIEIVEAPANIIR